MLYNKDNRNKWLYDASKVYPGDFHDGSMVFMDYDRANRIAVIQVTNYYYHTKHRLTFRNVRLFFSSAFDAWGHSDDRLLEMGNADMDSVASSLKGLWTFRHTERTTAEKELEDMLGAWFLFASGHEMFIIGETIEVQEIAPPPKRDS